MSIFSRLRNLWKRDALDENLNEELRAHIEMRAELNVAGGMSPKEARDAAQKRFGNETLVKERTRDADLFTWIESVGKDLRYGSRALRKNLGFTAVAVIVLTLGIGLNTTVFTLFNEVVLRPIPVKDPANVVELRRTVPGDSVTVAWSYPEFVEYRGRNGVFDDMAVYTSLRLRLTDRSGADGDNLQATAVSGSYFSMLGVEAALGRTFGSHEGWTPGSDPIVILSNNYWRAHFGGEQNAIGSSIVLNSQKFVVAGVMPREFRGVELFAPDCWVPLSMISELIPGDTRLHDSGNKSLQGAVARLKSGITIAQAQASISVLASQFGTLEPGSNTKLSVALTRASFLPPEARTRFFGVSGLFMVAVAMVLLIGCVNLANMLLARGSGRHREIAIRLTLGATRGRLVRQLMVESLLLALAGGAGGLLLTAWAPGLLLLITIPPAFQRYLPPVSPDLHVFLYSLVLSLVTGIFFGLTPALAGTKVSVSASLKNESPTLAAGRTGRSKLRNTLVTVQVAVCLVLLVSAGLFIRGFQRTQVVDTGFDYKHLVVLSLDSVSQRVDPRHVRLVRSDVLEGLRNTPGVLSAALSLVGPLSGNYNGGALRIPGKTADPNRLPMIGFQIVSPEFFDALDIKFVRGRNFTAQESRDGAAVVIINEAAARKFWPGTEPLGTTFNFGTGAPLQVVGIAHDSHTFSPFAIDGPCLFFPPLERFSMDLKYVVRTRPDPRAIAPLLRDAVHRIDSAVQVEITPVEANLEQWIWPSLVSVKLSSMLGLLALVLAIVGIYGVVAYLVAQRTREIGIRMALGAQRSRVLLLILSQAMIPVSGGIALGLGLSVALTRVFTRLLFGISPYDPLTLAGTAFLLTIVALSACYGPARRASRVDPMVALRYE